MLDRLTMTPATPYHGPLGLAGSQYASPKRVRDVKNILAANPELQEKMDAQKMMASREQTTDKAPQAQSPGAQVAQVQDPAIEPEVGQYVHAVDQTVSTVVAKTCEVSNRAMDPLLISI